MTVNEPTRDDIVAKVNEYVFHCLGCQPDQPLLIGTTAEEKEVADLFLDARTLGKSGLSIEDHNDATVPHSVLSKGDAVLAIMYEFTRGEGSLSMADPHLDNWKNLIEKYDVKHAVGFIDKAPGELPWRIALIGLNQKKQLVYGHGPDTTMDHMAGHFMIDYEKVAEFGQNLVNRLSDPEVVAYMVHSERGTEYVLLRDELTIWHNDLMPRPYTDPKSGELLGDIGNVPGGEVFEEYSELRHITELGTEIPVMTRRPAYGVWVGDLSVGCAKKSLKSSQEKAMVYVGINPADGSVIFNQGGVVTKWDCTDNEVKDIMKKELRDDPYVREGLVAQEPLAFGYNEKADPETDVLLEGEKAIALHMGFGGVLSHIDLLASLEGTDVILVKRTARRHLNLTSDDITSILKGKAPNENYALEKLISDGKYNL